jgi:hypothetical protein
MNPDNNDPDSLFWLRLRILDNLRFPHSNGISPSKLLP